MRVEVPERTLADGTIRRPVDTDAVKAAAAALRAKGAEAVAIVFINAYANDANERAALAALREVWPNPYVTASHEILPEIREFERASTAALNAYLQPVVASYLSRLDARLRESGAPGRLLVVQSNGGVMTVETAARLPVRTALSGPAAGVIAAAHIARSAGFPRRADRDMGGTSFDVALIAGGKGGARRADDGRIRHGRTHADDRDHDDRCRRRLDRVGRPRRPAADRSRERRLGPGPVAYGLGAVRPTVTDANVVMGRINAGAADRRQAQVARRQGSQPRHRCPCRREARAVDPRGGRAIVRVANSRMAGALRLVSIERGHEPQRFALMPFGGAGALHAGALMKETGLGSTLVRAIPASRRRWAA